MLLRKKEREIERQRQTEKQTETERERQRQKERENSSLLHKDWCFRRERGGGVKEYFSWKSPHIYISRL